MLEYYVASVTWRICPDSNAGQDRIVPVNLAVPTGTSKLGGVGFISVRTLEHAKIPPGTSAADVEALLSVWRRPRPAEPETEQLTNVSSSESDDSNHESGQSEEEEIE